MEPKRSYTMSIDGKQVGAAERTPVVNPATGEPFADAPLCSADQLEDALAAAERAFIAWRRDPSARRAALGRAAERLRAEAAEIARTLTLEQGKPLAQAQGEVLGAAAQLEASAKFPLPGELLRDDDKQRLELAYRPYGVVAGITPWNFPILIAMSKLAPALLTGNTMVLKPSPFTPLSTLQLCEVINRELPAGVLNAVSGDAALGAALTADGRVRKISFTGSVPTGKKIAAVAAQDLKRVTLELGGNDPAIVLDDASPQAIAPQLFWSAFTNCGQICIAVKRIYVPEAMLQPLTQALSELARAAVVGDGLDPQTQIGPVNNAMQLERVSALLDDAKRRGTVVHSGGERLARSGFFFPPTVLSGLDDAAPVVAEEQFGPLLPVLTYRSLDDALARANATHYGLGASVWSPDRERARSVARELDAGTVWINQHLALSSKAPFGGAKWSGIGLAGGRFALQAYMQPYVINERVS